MTREWEATDQTDEASHTLFSHCISSRLIVNTIIFRNYEDSTDESSSGSHETNSYVFKLKKMFFKSKMESQSWIMYFTLSSMERVFSNLLCI